MPATEEIRVTICKVSRPTSLGRFTAKHVPIPGGNRTGVYERVFMSKKSIETLLETHRAARIVISPDASTELAL